MSIGVERMAKIKAGELCSCCGSHPPRENRKTCQKCAETAKACKRRKLEEYRAVQREYYHRSKEKFRARARAWSKNNPEKIREKRRRRTLKVYGISPEEFKSIAMSQENKCAVCGEEPTQGRLVVDHSHSTGMRRGLLCTNCNAGIGLLGEDVGRLLNAALYLVKALQPQNGGAA